MNAIQPVRVAIIGYGYWGPNLVRNFQESDLTEIAAVCDLREERLKIVKKKYPFLAVTNDYDKLLADQTIDAIIIATPTSSHYPLAKKALLANKHVWIEKPMTDNSKHAEELVKIAGQKKRIIHVDHIFLYTEAVKLIKKMIDKGELGKIYYFDSVRINLGLFQPDTNVIWDLAVHDISIMHYLLGAMPVSVSTFATPHVLAKVEDTAYLTFKFPKRTTAHLHVSWLSPVKIRRTIIAGSKRMIVYNDLETSEKLKIYDYGVHISRGYKPESTTSGYHYRTGEIIIPALESKEALLNEVNHFAKSIAANTPTLTSGSGGEKVVKILEAAHNSLKADGKTIKMREEGNEKNKNK